MYLCVLCRGYFYSLHYTTIKWVNTTREWSDDWQWEGEFCWQIITECCWRVPTFIHRRFEWEWCNGTMNRLLMEPSRVKYRRYLSKLHLVWECLWMGIDLAAAAASARREREKLFEEENFPLYNLFTFINRYLSSFFFFVFLFLLLTFLHFTQLSISLSFSATEKMMLMMVEWSEGKGKISLLYFIILMVETNGKQWLKLNSKMRWH